MRLIVVLRRPLARKEISELNTHGSRAPHPFPPHQTKGSMCISNEGAGKVINVDQELVRGR